MAGGTLSTFATDPTIWAVGAVGLALVELAVPGFLMLGFGGGALIVAGLLALVPAAASLGVLGLFLLWAALSLCVWFALSRLVGGRSRQRKGADDINDFDNH